MARLDASLLVEFGAAQGARAIDEGHGGTLTYPRYGPKSSIPSTRERRRMHKQHDAPVSSIKTDRYILLDAVYRLDEFKRRTGLGDFAIRQARRHGLRVFRMGGKSFVRGADFSAYLDRADALDSVRVDSVESVRHEPAPIVPIRAAQVPVVEVPARDGLATIIEVSRYLRISRTAIYGLMDAGKLPFLRIGRSRRIAWSEVKALAARSIVGAGQRESQ